MRIKMLNNLKLRNHMMLSIGMVAFLAFAVTITFVSVKTGRIVEKEALDKAEEIAHRYENFVKTELDVAMASARTFSKTMEGVAKHRETINRDAIDEMLKQILLSNEMLSGIWCIFEPNMLDGRDGEFANHKWHDETGIYYPYFYRSNGKIESGVNDDYKTADYYQIPKRSGVETVIEPYTEEETENVLMTSLCVPIKENGKVIGVAGIDIFLKTIDESVSRVKVYETGFLSIVSNDGIFVTHPESERIGKSIFETTQWAGPFKSAITLGDGFTTENYSKTAGENLTRICRPIQIGETKTPWAVLVNIPKSKVRATANKVVYVTILIGVVSLLVLIAALFVITGAITVPLVKGVHFAQLMSDGDFTQRVDIDQKDEIGTLAGALNSMTLSLGSILKDVMTGIDTLTASSSDLSVISRHMTESSRESSGKSGMVNRAAEDVNTDMGSVAAATQQASGNLDMVSAATEEMTATINEIARNTEKARGVTGTAVLRAQNASERVNELGKAAQEIGKVTEAITEISAQTNLLALNATIEAARAGEAGKGFAVVAGEIKDLAGQTAKATSEIKGEIENIQATIAVTVDEIKQISDVNNEVSDIVSGIATSVEEQSITTKEVATNIAQASVGIRDVNDKVSHSAGACQDISREIAEISHASDDISASSSKVNLSAEKMAQLAEELNEKVKRFKV